MLSFFSSSKPSIVVFNFSALILSSASSPAFNSFFSLMCVWDDELDDVAVKDGKKKIATNDNYEMMMEICKEFGKEFGKKIWQRISQGN
ncbi:hypothetical protein L195_g023029 [Trifolium pratense]|uniref:Uncharacterized protein n=1 Tax=Trifolium pratense TaxID=57577 RepID=A0A2K3N9R2_TRIPR|nr:hypothetical protein L195_g023029 [Trifolium pratense]